MSADEALRQTVSHLVDRLRDWPCAQSGDAFSSHHVGCLLNESADTIARLHAKLEQIAIVCTDNMGRDCNHRMALDFVRNIANENKASATMTTDTAWVTRTV